MSMNRVFSTHLSPGLLVALVWALSNALLVSSSWAANGAPASLGVDAALPLLVQRVEPAMVPADADASAQPQSRRALAPRRARVMLERPDALRQAQSMQQARSPGAPVKIGYPREVPGLRGRSETLAALDWTVLPGGARVVAIGVDSPEATAVRLGVRIFSLPNEARVRIYGPNADQDYEVAGKEIRDLIERNLASGNLSEEAHTWWAPAVEGTEAVIEIELPAGVDTNDVQLAIPRISHQFAGLQLAADIGSAASCNLDVSCYQSTWDSISRATAHIDFVSGGYTMICTGTLLNDKDTTTAIPYFLTANHCISDQIEASSMTTHWFFRSVSCNSGGTSSAYRSVQGGATLLYNNSNTDTAFMRLNASPPAGAMFAGWSTSAPAIGSGVTAIHHPEGDLQKISFGSIDAYLSCSSGGGNVFCYGADLASSDHLQVGWSSGTTEPGSSGSGLFLNNGQYLVGTLHAASPACGSDPYAFYGRFDLAYADGLAPYLNNSPSSSYTLTVSASGTGTGTITGAGISCGSACKSQYASGTSVTLTATPAAGSVFSGWSGACTNTSGSCVVTMTAAKSVVANFSKANEMTLRDAIYLYNKPIYSNAYKAVIGYHCDVFQLLLSVKSGFTDLAMVDSTLSKYPDRIVQGASMFAYSLYSPQASKAFRLANNSVGVADSQVGTATFFAYCFSSQPDAYVAQYDAATKICTKANGTVISCSGLDAVPKLPKLASPSP
jgi:lysyl endopeptidase